MKQSRLSSKTLWVSVTGAIILLAGQWGLYELIGIEKELIQNSIDTILFLLVSFGVLNNPTDKENF